MKRVGNTHTQRERERERDEKSGKKREGVMKG